MHCQFTPAAQRTLVHALAWSAPDENAEVTAPALLLGLLLESECWGAQILARHGVDQEAVLRHWPELRSAQRTTGVEPRHDSTDETHFTPPRFSDDVASAIQAACRRMDDYPRPLTLATEHLLWGLALADQPVAAWLRSHQFDAVRLEAEIRNRHAIYDSLEECPPEIRSNTPCPTSDSSDGSISQASVLDGQPDPLLASDHFQILRVMDAAANRAREGLRVLEDFVRFGLDDLHLTERFKRLRHALTLLLNRIPWPDRLAARETLADVGTTLTLPSEQSRQGVAELLDANFARLQEALRSLEEHAKTFDSGLAAELEQIRYQTYTLHRAVQITRSGSERLHDAHLYVLLDGQPSPEALERLVQSLVASGVDVLQLRDKRLDDRALLARARLVRRLTRGTSTRFIVNDRADLAVLAAADGVHVGQEELSVKDARTIVGAARLVGVSTHSIEQARQAVLDGADYIGVGPVFPSGTKQFRQFPGLELVRAVAAEIRLPAFAIGGIDLENLGQVLSAGGRRVAISGAIAAAADPAAAAAAIKGVLASRS
jgi:thiamine-phosphate pyrophosphorylase